MRNTLLLVFLGLITFCVFLLATAPATLLTWAAGQFGDIHFEHVAGTVWNGQCQQLRIQRVSLGPVAWNITPSRLLHGELALQVQIGFTGPDPDPVGQLALTAKLPGSLTIEKSRLRASAEWVSTQAALPIMPSGDIVADIEHARLRPRQLPQVNARLSWQNAGVTYPNPFELGRYLIDIHHQPDDDNPQQLIGSIHDENSPLHINGEAVLDSQGQYRLDVNVRAEDYAPADVAALLPLLGRRQADGSVNLKRQGSLSAAR